MIFNAVLAACDDVERDRLIAAEIASHDWLDHVAKWMSHGGWPEFVTARVLEITADADALRVAILLDYVELCPKVAMLIRGVSTEPRPTNW